MTDSKLLETIVALTEEERSAFALFIESPYFNRGAYNHELPALYAFILAASPEFEAASLQKELAHGLIFPDKPYSEGRIDRMMFEINKLAKDFLLTQHYFRDENELGRLIDHVTILRQKNIVARVEKELEKIQHFQSGSQKRSLKQQYNSFLAAEEVHYWKSWNNKAKDDVGLPELIEALDTYYFGYRLELYNQFLILQKAIGLNISESTLAMLQRSTPPPDFENSNPLLLITLKINLLLKHETYAVADFQDLLNLLTRYEHELDADALSKFFVYLRNLCTLLIDEGRTDFDPLLHTLQKDNLSRGYFYTEGKIHPNSCLSIVQQALRAEQVPWAHEFLELHKDRIIGENESRDFYRMNLALCLFAEGKHEQALDTIPFGSSYSFYHLMARRLELKIYYETDSKLLPSKIDAFKMFISRVGRKNLSANLSTLLLNFGNFVAQLSQSIPGDTKRAAQLEKRIREKKLVGERSWLLDKARELANKK